MTVARGVLRELSDSEGIQLAKVDYFAGETREGIERFQDYGFTSVPFPDAECATMFVGGNREHGLIVKIDDRKFRLKNLAPGEVALYTDEGDKIEFKRGNIINIVGANEVNIETTDAVINASNSVEVNTSKATVNATTSADITSPETTVTATTEATITTATATINATTKVDILSPMVNLGIGAVNALINSTTFQQLFNDHKHIDSSTNETSAPTSSFGPTHLSTTVKASP